MTVVALLFSGCAVQIQDYQFCSPIPGNLGAVCDNFLTSNQVILDEAAWLALQASWNAQGQAVECTQSGTLGSLKSELEKLCSETPCDYPTQQAVAKVTAALEKIETLGKNKIP